MGTNGDKIRALNTIYRTATLQGLTQYSGGKGSGKNAGIRPVSGRSSILSNHFRHSNVDMYQPLSPQYKKAKARKGFGHKPILVATEKTRDSILGKARILSRGKDTFIIRFPHRTSYSIFLEDEKDRHPTRPTQEELNEVTKIIIQSAARSAREVSRMQPK